MAQNFLSDIKLGDSIYIRLGDRTFGDLNLYHNGTNSFIDNHTGNVYIRNFSDDKNIHLQSDDGNGGMTDYIVVHGSENIVKFQEHTRHLDNKQARFGTGSDLKILHDGTNSVISNQTGDLQIINNADDKDIVFYSDDGSGSITEYFRVDGDATNVLFSRKAKFSDNVEAVFGDGADLKIFHDGTNAVIRNNTGDLFIDNYADDKDIVLRTDDGTGSQTPYYRLDGGLERNIFYKTIRINGAGAGYLKTDANGDVSIDTSTIEDTLQTVTDRGSTTTNTMQGTRLGLGGAPHASAALQITTTAQHLRMYNGSELGVMHVLSSGELELWAHGEGETINFRTGSGSGVLAAHIDGTNTTFAGTVNIAAGTTGSVGGGHAGIVMTNRFDNPDNSFSIKPQISGVSNTGLEIRDETDNASRLVIDGSGKVGIGTNAPAQKLDISGHVSIRGTNKIYFNHDTNTARYIGASSANDLDIAADDDINLRSNFNRFFNASTEFARLSGSSNSWIANDSNGKLGVGLNSPASTLHVLGPNAASGGITLTSSTSDNTQKVGRIKTSHYDTSEEPFTAILTNAQATDNVLRLGGGSGAENAATDIRFYTAANNTTLTGTERLHINESGNATFTGDVLAPIFYDSNNTDYFLNPAGTATSLKVAGSVGIGRSPVGKLTIEGDGSVDSNIFFQQSGSQEHRIYAATNNQYNTIGSSSPKWYWGQHQSSGSPTIKMSLVGDALTAGSFVKSGGTSSQFLKADGSVDSNTYLTSSSTQSKYLRSDAADTGTGTITLADNNTSDSPLILGSSAQTNYTLQQWRTSAHGENEAYILAYGAGHTSQAGNFAIKNIESGGEIFFELAGGVEPLRMTSTGATFAGAVIATGAVQVPYAASTKKPMIVLNGATNYGLFHTEASSDIFSFDFNGSSKHQFKQDGSATFEGTISSGAITSTGTSSGRYTGLEIVNTTNAAGTETAIGLGVVSAANSACDVKLVANRVAANSGSDFYIEQTNSSGTQVETFRIAEDGNATFAGIIKSSNNPSSNFLDFDDDSTTHNSDTNVTTLGSVSGIALATNLNDGGGGDFTVSTGSTGTELLKITTAGNATFEGSAQTTKLGIGVAPSSVYGINQDFNSTDANTDNKFAYFIDADFSGSDNTTGDREQGGIKIDIDSSADGDSSDEHRLYGIWVDQRTTGFSDLSRAGYFYNESNIETANETPAEVTGMYAIAVADSTETTAGMSNLYGVQGLTSIQDSGYVGGSYGGFFKNIINTTRAADLGSIVAGVRGEVEIDSTNSISITQVRAVDAVIDTDSSTPTVTNGYLFKGSYEGTPNVTNKYGLYITGSASNLIDGSITLATSGNFKSDSVFQFLNTGSGAQYGKFRGIQVSTSYSGTPPSQGILFGTDTNLYRDSANVLKTDDSLIVATDLTVEGNLYVTGTSTAVNVEDLNVEQGEITLNYGTGDTSAAADGSGIRIQDAVNGTTDATILWDQTNAEFDFSHGATLGGKLTIPTGSYDEIVFTGTGGAKILAPVEMYLEAANDIYLRSHSGANLTLGNNTATFAGDVTVNGGDITVNTTGKATLTLNGDSDNSGDAAVLDSEIKMLHDGGDYGMLLQTQNHSGRSSFKIVEKITTTETMRFQIDETGDATFAGTVTATSFTGDGANISNVYKKIYDESWGATPEAKYIEITLPFISGSGASKYYYFDVLGYRDIGSMDSQLHYRVYLHNRANGVDNNDLSADVFAINEAASESFGFGFLEGGASSSKFLIKALEDYSRVAIVAYPSDAVLTSSMISSTETAPTGYTDVTFATTRIKGDVEVGGDATFAGDVEVTGTLTIDGDGASNAEITSSTASSIVSLNVGGFTGTPSLARDVRFFTNSASNSRTERMRILSGGNVAIGRTTADEKLHVGGTGKFDGDLHFGGAVLGQVYRPVESGSATDRFFLMFDYTNNASYPFLTNRTPNGAVVVKTGTAAGGGENEHFRIKGGDGTVDAYFTNVNLGIGTNSPLGKLEISSSNVIGSVNGGADELVIQNNGYSGISILSNNANAGQILFGDNDANVRGQLQYWHSDDSMRFGTSASERMRITSSGNVGIGVVPESTWYTGGQTRALQIGGTVSIFNLFDTRSVFANNYYLTTDGSDTYINTDEATQYYQEGGQHIWKHAPSGTADTTITWSESMRIASDGKVGIGTTSPSKRLHVYQTGNNQPLLVQTDDHVGIQVKGGNSHDRYISFQQANGSVGSKVGWDHSSQTLKLNAVDSFASTHLAVDVNGNVGIGTTSPSRNLSIVSDSFYSLELQGSNAYNNLVDTGIVFSAKYNSSGQITDVASIRGGRKSTADGNFAGVLKFFTRPNGGSDTERMRIDSSGDLFFGNTVVNPASGFSNQKGLGYDTSAGVLEVASTTSAALQLGRNQATDGDVVAIRKQGTVVGVIGTQNWGIGTASPDTKLHITDTSSAFQFTADTGTAGDGRLNIGHFANGTFIGTYGDDGGAADLIRFGTHSGDERMRIHSNGNISVGTTNAYARLSVKATSHNNGISVNRQADTTAAIYIGNDGGNNPVLAANNADMIFGRDFSNTFTERMRLTNDGNLGIGTDSPGAKLEIKAASAEEGIKIRNVNSQDTFHLGHLSSEEPYFQMKNNAGTTELVFRCDNGDNYINTGNLGIGTASPSTKLYVDNGESTFNRGNSAGTIATFRGLNSAQAVIGTATSYFLSDVGIGTTSPTRELEVQGAGNVYIKVSASTDNDSSAIELENTQETWTIKNDDTNNDAFEIDSSTTGNIVTIQKTGNVGIATSSPDRKLHVTGDDSDGIKISGGTNGRFIELSSSNLNYYTTSSGGYAMGQRILKNSDSSVLGAVSGAYGTGSALTYMYYGGTAYNDAAMYILPNKNIGIGTNAPARDLHLKKSNSGGQVRAEVFNTSNTANSHGIVSIYSGGASAGDPFLHWKVEGIQDWSMGIDNSDSDKLKISKNFGPGTNDYLSIDTSGNATFAGNVDATNFRDKDNTSYSLTPNSGSQGQWRVNTPSGYVDIGPANASYSHFSTDRGRFYFNKKLVVNEGIIGSYDEDLKLRRADADNDYILIRDTSIGFFLDTAEDMRLENDGDLHVEGDVIAYSTTISDNRLKDDVVTIDSALDKVSKLRGVEYTWNATSRKGQKDIGVIAQEVEEVIPEIVREKEMALIDGGKYKTVDYEKLTAVLIEAVKELKEEVEELKNKCNDCTC